MLVKKCRYDTEPLSTTQAVSCPVIHGRFTIERGCVVASPASGPPTAGAVDLTMPAVGGWCRELGTTDVGVGENVGGVEFTSLTTVGTAVLGAVVLDRGRARRCRILELRVGSPVRLPVESSTENS